MNTIGEKIRAIRTLKGFSQENMAAMLNVSLPTYTEIERGKRKVNNDRLEEIADKLGVTVNDIENFNDRVNNFFDNCNSANVATGAVNNLNGVQNNYDHRELQHQIEKQALEIKLLQAEKQKSDIEVKYWKQIADNKGSHD